MEKVLVFGVGEEKLASIYKVCSQMKTAVICVEENEMDQTLEHLLENKSYKGNQSNVSAGKKGQEDGESMIVMCDMTEKHVDKLLAALRMNHINVDYKAVLTPTNRSWSGRKMMFQMNIEKRAYQK